MICARRRASFDPVRHQRGFGRTRSRQSFPRRAKDKIADAVAGEGAGANTVVLSEFGVRSKAPEAVPGIMQAMGFALRPLPVTAAVPAAKAFALYLSRLKKEGKANSARSPLPDFFIGAHAEAEGLALVTRDPDTIRTYFPQVKLISP